jgi:hypothetical protein
MVIIAAVAAAGSIMVVVIVMMGCGGQGGHASSGDYGCTTITIVGSAVVVGMVVVVHSTTSTSTSTSTTRRRRLVVVIIPGQMASSLSSLIIGPQVIFPTKRTTRNAEIDSREGIVIDRRGQGAFGKGRGGRQINVGHHQNAERRRIILGIVIIAGIVIVAGTGIVLLIAARGHVGQLQTGHLANDFLLDGSGRCGFLFLFLAASLAR